jgi:phosphate transport system substrate-binding protein
MGAELLIAAFDAPPLASTPGKRVAVRPVRDPQKTGAMNSPGSRRAWLLIAALALTGGCSGSRAETWLDRPGSERSIIRIVGSDTMVNLLQAWAEEYTHVQPQVMVQVAGGGSGVGIAGLIDGTLDIAAASREMRAAERQRVTARYGTSPGEFTVARDALAVYVHASNPLDAITFPQLADIYGDHASIRRWSQLGVAPPACRSGEIIRVGRQNNSGTFAHFRDVVLGRREYEMGSIDQSGSKDVVALLSRTPCAIGYSGIAFMTAGVKALKVGAGPDAAAGPGAASVLSGAYPLARPLYLYTSGPPREHLRAFLDWIRGPSGQRVAIDLGFMPAAPESGA